MPSITDIIEKCLNVKLATFESSITAMSTDLKKLEAAVCSNEKGILDVANKCQSFETKLNKLNSAVNDISVSNSAFVSDSKQLQKSFSDLLAHNKTLSTNCAALKKELNDMSFYMRRDNLIFHGLVPSSFVNSMAAPNASSDAADLSTYVSNTATELTVIQFCSDVLGVNLSLDDISATHRLPVRNKQPHGAPASTPIIVKFTNRRARDNAYSARKQLKGQSGKVYINEHLSTEAAMISKSARNLVNQKKLISTWTLNGSVFIKDSDLPTARPKKITNLNQLPQ